MKKSNHRKILESALERATDSASVAALSAELTALGLLEDRRSSRRQKAKAAKVEPWPPPIDPNTRIVIDMGPPPAPGPAPARLDLTSPAHRDLVGLSPVPAERTAPPAHGDGRTYTRASYGPPWAPDSPSCGPDTGRAGQCVGSNDWNATDGFSFAVADDFGNLRTTNERELREGR